MEETVTEFFVEDMDSLANVKDELSVQDLKTLDISALTPLTPNVISRQATINIGTIGHVAHGKSTIVKAISGVKTVKHSTELVRNITIKLGYANAKIYKCNKCPRPRCYKSYGSSKADNPKCDTEGCEGQLQLQRHVSFVDCPGHDILMATMLTGAAVMDAALLLIAANETCPQPQTSEHLAAIELMKLKKVFILQNKIDLVRDSDATEHYKQILQFIQCTIADGSPIIPVSAQLGYNIDVLCENLVKNIPIPERMFLEPPRLIVIRSFDVNKPGTSIDKIKGGVAGGSITQGVLKIGDRIEVKPGVVTSDSAGHFQCSPIYSVIESLFAEANQLQYAVPGGLIGVGTKIDPTLCRADRLVGQVLGQEGTLPDVFVQIEISFFLLSRLLGIKEGDNKKIKVKKISRGESLMINVGSTSTGGTVTAVREDLAIISLARPVCSKVNEKIAISRRVDRHWRLIGWGSILCGTKVVSSKQSELSNNISFADENDEEN